jgi:holo-[acyl-carrier protein] synthase
MLRRSPARTQALRGFDPDSASDRKPLRVGVDLASVDEVAASILRFGSRYTGRLFTPGELADTEGPAQAARLAARFAAKEATIKALAPATDAPSWRSIEVRKETGGECSLILHGRAVELAEEAGLDTWALSMSHEGRMAVAVVAATGRGTLGGDAEESEKGQHG